jgi:hypothetical protein
MQQVFTKPVADCEIKPKTRQSKRETDKTGKNKKVQPKPEDPDWPAARPFDRGTEELNGWLSSSARFTLLLTHYWITLDKS